MLPLCQYFSKTYNLKKKTDLKCFTLCTKKHLTEKKSNTFVVIFPIMLN